MKKRKWWVVTAISWMVIIFLCTQLPYFTGDRTATAIHKTIAPSANYEKIDVLNLIIRKATHITAFGLLSIFILKSLEPKRFAYLTSGLLTIIYSLSDEWHQSFMPGRTASLDDVLIDALGASFALSILFFYRKRKEGKRG